MNNPYGEDGSGVRAPDEARFQALTGPEADYDPEEDRRFLLEQQRIDRQSQGIMSDMASSMANAAGALGRFMGLGGGNEP